MSGLGTNNEMIAELRRAAMARVREASFKPQPVRFLMRIAFSSLSCEHGAAQASIDPSGLLCAWPA